VEISTTEGGTPFTGPLVIDGVDTPGGGRIGMMHCPGRCVGQGPLRPWGRDLATDLAAIDAWGADILLTLVETKELATLGVPNLPLAASHWGFIWRQMPIPDYQRPNRTALIAWDQHGPEILSLLQRGGRLAIHCAAGLGRTGTVAAKLLVALGLSPDAAIASVRAARPGTIETADQEDFVRNGLSFNRS
jgi:ADP-ribosyl-[dinitrogen reductase] hydrolase